MSTIEMLRARWADFTSRPAPDGLGDVAADVDVDLLVATASDCIDAYLATGLLSPRENGALRACHIELKRIVPRLDGERAAYLESLANFAGQIMARPNLPGFFG